MNKSKRTPTIKRLLLALFGICSTSAVLASPPDLTTNPVIDTTYTFNFGPTGARGWIFTGDQTYVNNVDFGPTWDSRQMLVTYVAPGTPAAGILQSNDVILGIGSSLFTNDCRVAYGNAITAAEAGNGVLSLNRWRAGVTTTVSIQLQWSNIAYSATMPFNCPKSSLILSNAASYLATQPLTTGNGDGSSFAALALLATGNTNYLPMIQSFAYAEATTNLNTTTNALHTWDLAYIDIFLSEYYLATGDTNVLNGINALTWTLANGQDMWGTYWHYMTPRNPDGSAGISPYYGPVNECGEPANVALVLAQKCGITNSLLAQDIATGSNFFSYYANKGSVPYGEHIPTFTLGQDNQGKNAWAAILFGLEGATNQAQYFAKMTAGSFGNREIGHSDSFFGQLMPPLGALIGGGPAAMTANMQQYVWELEMCRCVDGHFEWEGDCTDTDLGYSAGNNNNGTNLYYNFPETAAYLLHFAAPLQQLYLTGKNWNTNNTISSNDIATAIFNGYYNPTNRTTNQLFGDLTNWSVTTRYTAALYLSSLATNVTASVVPTLIAMAAPTNANFTRMGAVQALGFIKNTNAWPTIITALNDSDRYVRYLAGDAAADMSQTAGPYLTNLLNILISNAVPINPMDPSDPLQLAQTELAQALFSTNLAATVQGPGISGILGASLASAPTNLLYPALTATANLPTGASRNNTLKTAFSLLSLNDVKALAPSLVNDVANGPPADPLFGSAARTAGINILNKYKVEEAIPLAMDLLTWYAPAESDRVTAMNVLTNYGTAAQVVIPELTNLANQWILAGNIVYGQDTTNAAQALATVTNLEFAQTAPTMTYFKTINSLSASPTQLISPQTNTTLNTFVADLAADPITISWSKIRGAGYVGFNPNGTSASTNSTASLYAPGSYVLQMAAYDSVIDPNGYAAVTGEVIVTNGTATNLPPVAFPQYVIVTPNTPQAINLLGEDPSGYALIYAVITNPTNGTLLGTEPYLTYQPNPNYQGVDSFTFVVTNSQGVASPAVTITLNVLDPLPVANAQTVATTPNTATSVTLTGSDACSLPLTYAIAIQPTKGTLTGTPPNMTYTPTNSYIGADSFAYYVNNGLSNSPNATVSINVASAQLWTNKAPGNWSAGADWLGGTAPAAGGATNYSVTFSASSYAGYSSNDLSGTFALNQLTFAAGLPVMTNYGNALLLTSNSTIPPEIWQNSTNAVVLADSLTLGTNTVVSGTAVGKVTLSGAISGAGSLTIAGATNVFTGTATNTTLVLFTNNSYSGGTVLSSGSLAYVNQYAFGTGTITLAGGTAFRNIGTDESSAGMALTNAIYLSGGLANILLVFDPSKPNTSKYTWLSGPITGPGGLCVIADSNAKNLTLSGAKTFTGGMLLAGTTSGTSGNSALTMDIDNLGSLGTGPVYSQLQGTSFTAGNITPIVNLTNAPGITNLFDITANSHLTVNANGTNNLLISGLITDSGTFVKVGSATLMLSATNNVFTGSVQVNAGTLQLNNPYSLSSATALYLTNTATLNLAFTGTNIVQSLYINGVQQANGVYSSSTAPITGTGYLLVGSVPDAPTDLMAVGENAQIALNWTAPSETVSYYNVKRAASPGGPYTNLATVTWSSTWYADTTVVNGTTYYYEVSAVGSVGESLNSVYAGATPAATPAAPASLAANAPNSWINLAWPPSANAAGYNVKRSLTTGGPYAVINSVDTTNYTDVAVNIGTSYYYVVSAYNGAGESTNSSQATAIPIQLPSVSWTNIAAGSWTAGASWQGGSAPAAGGSATYFLNFNTSPYAGISSNGFNGTFAMNRLTFGASLAPLTNNGNPLYLTINGSNQPALIKNTTNLVVISNSVSLAGNATVSGTGTNTLTLAGVISGPGSLTQTNNGTLALGAVTNTYSGGTTLNAGILQFGNKNSFGSGLVTLAGGTSLEKIINADSSGPGTTNAFYLGSGWVTNLLSPYGISKSLWLSGPISGPGGFLLTSDVSGQTLYLSGAKTFAGGVKLVGVNVNQFVSIDNLNGLGSGNLRSELSGPQAYYNSGGLLANAVLTNAPGVTNTIDLANATNRLVVLVNSPNNLWLSGAITNAGALIKAGTGPLILSGNSTYNGQTIIEGGVLSVTTVNSVTTPPPAASGSLGDPSSAANGTITLGCTSSNLANNATPTAPATLLYTGANDETSDRVINLGSTTNGATIDQSGGGYLKFTSPNTATGVGIKTLTLQGSMTGSGEIAGALVDCSSFSTNTVTGAIVGTNIIVVQGLTGFAVGNSISGTGIAAGTTVTSISTGAKTVTLSSAVISPGVSSNEVITISGTTSLAKAGTGTWTLSGANTYSGTTTVNGGTLLINGTLSTNLVTVNTNATLGGTGTIAGPVLVTNNATLASGTIANPGVLTINGSVALAASATNAFRLNQGGTSDQIITSAAITYGGNLIVTSVGSTLAAGNSFQLWNAPGYAGSFATISLPALSTGLYWYTNNLPVNGTIAVSNITFTLTYTAGANGSISGTSPQTVIYGANGSAVTAVPNTGAIFNGWSDGSSANPRTDTGVTNNISVTANFVFVTNVFWDANSTGSGQTDGSGGWLGANQWWDGTTNQNWFSAVPNNAFIGIGGAGGTIGYAGSGVTVGSLTFSNFTGTYTLMGTNGVLTINNGITNVSTAGAVTFQDTTGGMIALGGSQTWLNNSSLGVSGGTLLTNIALGAYTLTIDGTGTNAFGNNGPSLITGTGGIVKNGSGILVLSSSSAYWTGPLTINSGTVKSGGNGSRNFMEFAPLTMNGGTLDIFLNNGGGQLIGTNVTIAANAKISSDANAVAGMTYLYGPLSIGASTLTVDDGTATASGQSGLTFGPTTLTGTPTFNVAVTASATNTLLTLGAVSGGANGLIKTGAGTLALSGTDTYTGATTVNGGTLLVNGTLGTNLVTVNTNGTLGGTGTIGGSVLVTNNATLSPGTSSPGVLTINGSVNLAANSTNLFQLNKGGTSDQVVTLAALAYAGNLNVTSIGSALAAGDSFQLWNASSYAGSFASVSLPALSTGLFWYTNNLPVNGTIAVSNITFTLTYTAGANGSISGTSPQTVIYGANGSAVTAVPNGGSIFSSWSDGSTANPRTDTGVTTSTNVTANFTVINLVWDANNTGSGQTDGSGGWLGANQWWNGANNLNWSSTIPDNAFFGNGGAGGTVGYAGSGVTIGSLTFSNYTGTYTLMGTNGVLTINNGITNISTAGAVNFQDTAGGSIILGGSQTWLNNSTLAVSGTTLLTNIALGTYTLTIDGTGTNSFGNNGTSLITGTGGIVKNGSGIFILSSSSPNWTGPLTINSGTVKSGGNGSRNFMEFAPLTMNGGTLDIFLNGGSGQLIGTNVTIAANAKISSDANALAGMTYSYGPLSIGASTLTVDDGTATASGQSGLTFGATTLTGTPTFNVAVTASATNTLLTLGAIGSSANGLIKTGTGTLKLTGTNTYTGPTTISAGTLQLGSATAFITNTAAITIAAGATFDVSAFATYTLATNLNASGSSATAVIKGATTVNLGSQAIQLTYDGTNPPLTVFYTNAAVGNLIFTNLAVTVTNNGTALAAGTYHLIQLTNATTLNVTNNGTPTVNVVGTGGLATGDSASIGTAAGYVNLVVSVGGGHVVSRPSAPLISGISNAGAGNLAIAGTGATQKTFVLMTSPSLSAPVSAWTPVATNTSGSGAFNFTIPVGNQPSMFYRVLAR